MGPGDADDWDEGEVAEEDDSSLGEPWPECLALVSRREKDRDDFSWQSLLNHKAANKTSLKEPLEG